jgi:hypothetical protein
MNANVIEYPSQGAYIRLPVTASNAEIIPFPHPMRADLPDGARVQMAELLRERQIQDAVSTALAAKPRKRGPDAPRKSGMDERLVERLAAVLDKVWPDGPAAC